ncbi:MAG: hypothetical protein ACI8WB_004532 [Phenylobacterium sp.]|jgi:hypothetical protein
MVFAESSIFTKVIKALMSDDEYRALQAAIIQRPDLGVLIKDSGGLRKIRWKLEGRGKSGGIRAIYYWMVSDDQVYMVYAYPKAKQENLTPEQVAALKKIVQRWNDE